MPSHPLRSFFSRPWCRASLTALLLLATPVLAHGHGTLPMADSSNDLGRLSFPTSTTVPAAQAAFERGMLWMHLFEYDFAVAEFQKAEKLDPNLALAYWGEAMTHTHAIWNEDEPEAARAALAKLGPTPAARAAKAPTAREKAFLDTGEQEFGPGTLKERDTRFLAATEALATRYPDDDEAQLLHALALLGITRGERNVDNYLQAAAIARKVLSHNPMHPGAAHYWIHGMDDPGHAQGALEAAHALSQIAPGAGHAQHMVSHIYMALGMWDEVIVANEKAMRVDNAQSHQQGMPDQACFHYNEWLQYAYFQVGRANDGQRLLAECVGLGAQQLAWMMLQSPRAAAKAVGFQHWWHDSLVGMRATSIVESAKDAAYDAALRADIGDIGRDAGWDAFALGYAAIQSGKVADARAELTQLRAIAARPPTSDENDPHTTDYLDIAADSLQGLIESHDGHGEDALARVRAAAMRYEALPFEFGPPLTVKPPRELAGELLLGMGRPKEAVVEFDLALKMAPRRALSMLGRARALAAAGEADASKRAYADLAAMWVRADPDLPALTEVRAKAAGSGAPGNPTSSAPAGAAPAGK